MRHVLSRRFGLDGEPPQTLEEVGAGLGITRERVRQLESRALRELRAGRAGPRALPARLEVRLGGVEPRFVDCPLPRRPVGRRRGADDRQTGSSSAASWPPPRDRDPLRDAARLAAPAADRGARARDSRVRTSGCRPQARLELRLGFELTPAPPLLREDPAPLRCSRAPTSSWSRCRSRVRPPTWSSSPSTSSAPVCGR